MARNRSIDISEMIQLAEDPAQYMKNLQQIRKTCLVRIQKNQHDNFCCVWSINIEVQNGGLTNSTPD